MSADKPDTTDLQIWRVLCNMRDGQYSAFKCTPENPWHVGLSTPVEHSDVHEVGEQEDGYPGGDIVTYECRNCGHRWKSELPQ